MPNKKYSIVEQRFYLLFAAIILSTLLGLVVLFQKSPGTISNKWGGSSLGLFSDKKFAISNKGIVIVNIEGVIQFGVTKGLLGIESYGADYIVKKINHYAKQKKVKGMIIRINSPGGTIGAVQEIYNAVIDFRKTGKYVIASMADIATSGGYYIAAGCDEIYANPGTMTGSIGVIIMAPSFKDLFKKIGVDYNVFKSGKHKDILSSHRSVTKEERKILQSVIDDAYKQFYNVVKKSRNIKKNKLKVYADGRIFTGFQAKKHNLIDSLGDMTTVIKVIGEKTGLGDEPEIIEDRMSPIEKLLSKLNRKESVAEKVFDLYTQKNINFFYMYMP